VNRDFSKQKRDKKAESKLLRMMARSCEEQGSLPVCSLISLKRIEFQYNGLLLFPQLHEFYRLSSEFSVIKRRKP